MKCEEAGEFVSRLCDGQVISREAAEHVGACQECRQRLDEYLKLGAELRRLASLERPEIVTAGTWKTAGKAQRAWWKRGRTAMRIPRFAFMSMLVLILMLSGGLALVRVRAAQTVPTLMLHFTLVPAGKTGECWLTTDDNPRTDRCGFATDVPDGGMVGLMFRFVSRNGNRTQLGVKANYRPNSNRFNFIDDFTNVPETMISVDPVQQAKIDVPHLGEFQVTSAYVDHSFKGWGSTPDEPLPSKNRFAVVDPVLIRANQVVCDLSANGYSIDDGDDDAALMIYCPGEGRYLISSVPFEGAVEGAAKMAQIRFTLDGEDYLFMSGMPILRSTQVWVSHDPDYKISDHIQVPGASDDHPFFRVRSLKLWLQSGILRNINP